jgi:hypothetical protein
MNLYVEVPHSPVASTRLSRAQLTQKIGAGTNGYPRPAGVLLPRALAELCRPLSASPQDRRQCGREIVLWVSRSQRRLPSEILDLEMPHPSTVLHMLPIEDRTRGVLDRLLPLIAKEPVWTVGRYLRIPKFGARCLVDLLAAYEETLTEPPGASVPGAVRSITSADAGRIVVPFTPVDLGRLDDIARLLGRLLPIAGAELGRLLAAEGLASAPVTLDHLAGVYRRMDRPAPFRTITSGGVDIAVAADNPGFAATVAATAVRLVSHWGLSTVESIVERVGVLRSAPTNRSIVCRLLVALPRLRWLDAAMEWFSFVGDRSRLARGIAKVFAVADRVPLRELRVALGKGQPRAPHVPMAVLERYLSEIAGCEIAPGGVHVRVPEPKVALAGDEAVVAKLLSDAGAQLEIGALTDLASSASLPAARVRRVLRSSPIFFRTRDRQVRLVGRRTRA